jgi:hypothetical protein
MIMKGDTVPSSPQIVLKILVLSLLYKQQSLVIQSYEKGTST